MHSIFYDIKDSHESIKSYVSDTSARTFEILVGFYTAHENEQIIEAEL